MNFLFLFIITTYMRLLHSIAIKFSIKKYFLKTDFKLQLKIRVFFKQNQKFNIEWNMYCNMHIMYITDFTYNLYYICMKDTGELN